MRESSSFVLGRGRPIRDLFFNLPAASPQPYRVICTYPDVMTACKWGGLLRGYFSLP